MRTLLMSMLLIIVAAGIIHQAVIDAGAGTEDLRASGAWIARTISALDPSQP